MTAIKLDSTRARCIIILAIILSSSGIAGAYATILQSQSVPLEIKEPLKILVPSQSLSVYPGETLPLAVDVENHASVRYNATLTFSLNDTDYQARYVIFSNDIYEIQPSINHLNAWLNVSSTAPTGEFELTIKINRNIEALSAPTPSPTQVPVILNPSMTLFTAGAKWAANNGTEVLYVNWYDNYCVHHFADPNWGPYWREEQLSEIKNTTVGALEQQDLKVTCVGDVPADLSSYNLVIFEAWFAVEPKHSQMVRDYLLNGGNVVIIGGVPCYFSTYCKNLWPYITGGENLACISDWFGSAEFVNSGGTASLVVDQPFGTPLRNQSIVYHIDAYGCYSLTSIDNDTQIIARWGSGSVYAFSHEYANGRVYYQAEMDW